MSSTLKDFVEYLDEVFGGEIKDVNGLENSIDLFFEFYKKNDVFDNETILFAKLLYEQLKKQNETIDDDFLALLIGMFLGLILGKFSKRIKIENTQL
jgi:hypothetical protein